MTTNLWSLNHPRTFWQCWPDPSDDTWRSAISTGLPVLGVCEPGLDIDSVLALTLGEGRFGPRHWTLSLPKRAYYQLKPFLPRTLTRALRQVVARPQTAGPTAQWPTDSSFADFLWEVLAQALQISGGEEISFRWFWPQRSQYALVLTHDIESQRGQEYVRKVADLEESLGLRSSFNFVPEGYPIDMGLVDELRRRGFEIGIHGLNHDGKMFNSRSKFERCAKKINGYLKDFGAVGFRAPLTIRNPEWLQALDIEYDLSFFDTDPFEPIPGGTADVWPFFIGRFVELPYTLVQDYTLTSILRECCPRIWLDKVDFLRKCHGMALVNAHPDYLKDQVDWDVYSNLLRSLHDRGEYWNALPRDVARWWKARSTAASDADLPGMTMAMARPGKDGLEVCL